MVYLPFILVSVLESTLIQLFGFTLFNIRIKGYVVHILITATLMAHISYSLRSDELSYLAPLVQLIFLIICIWGLFKIQFFYSAIIAISASAFFFVLQTVLFFAGNAKGMFSPDNVDRVPLGYLIPLLTYPLAILSIWLIRRFNLSMDWIPNNHKQKVEWSGFNILLTIILIAIFLLYGLTFYYLSIGSFGYLIIMFFLVLVLFYVLFSLTRRKDRQL